MLIEIKQSDVNRAIRSLYISVIDKDGKLAEIPMLKKAFNDYKSGDIEANRVQTLIGLFG